MSNIFYTEEELAFRDEVRAFCKKELVPFEEEIQKNNTYRKDLLRKIGEAGYMSTHHDVGFGKHVGKGLVYETIVAEEISAVCAGLDMTRMASATLFGKPVARFGTPDQIAKYLMPVLSGEKIGAIGITEPNVGSDVAGMETYATKDGDDYILNGHKYFITNGSQADFLCVFAITDKSVNPKKGMSAFIVENTMPGFSVIKDIDLMGMAGARVSELAFKDIRLSKDHLLGELNHGFGILMDELDSERVAIAGECLGYARPALEAAIKYSEERIQFKKPIKFFEGVSFQIADCAIEFEAARLLTLKAARAYDNGQKITKEAGMAKVYAAEMAVRVCDRAVAILGGRGYEIDYKVERYYRDARLMMIGGGTVEILRFLIQREVYKDFTGEYW
jgi:alkylation response protein AidB-like acyl-CoA dehydrogenase